MALASALALLVPLSAPGPLEGQDAAGEVPEESELRIELAHGSDAEARTAEALRRLVAEHDLGGWIRTREVRIDETAIPHSHPVLTLHTRHLGDDAALLATFLHEQFHWLEDAEPGFREAMARFSGLFPDAPAGSPEGGRDRESTWRHLVVCDLELQAMTLLAGEARAREVLSANRHYTWIYRTVLEDPRVRAVNTRHGMVAGDLRGPAGP